MGCDKTVLEELFVVEEFLNLVSFALPSQHLEGMIVTAVVVLHLERTLALTLRLELLSSLARSFLPTSTVETGELRLMGLESSRRSISMRKQSSARGSRCTYIGLSTSDLSHSLRLCCVHHSVTKVASGRGLSRNAAST
jgi:hypothetical protein